jgi:hypothetical protein
METAERIIRNLPYKIDITSTSSGCVSLPVKSSPRKTAAQTAQLGIQSGWLLKRDEQLCWHRRFCVLVPHTFLYYFEGEDSPAPRGIIDMEYYTNICTSEEGILSLQPLDGSPAREYLFQSDDPDISVQWSQSLGRGKYQVAIDERDAYMCLQEEFSLQMREKEQAVREKYQAVAEKESLAVEMEALAVHLAAVEARLEKSEACIASRDSELRALLESVSSSSVPSEMNAADMLRSLVEASSRRGEATDAALSDAQAIADAAQEAADAARRELESSRALNTANMDALAHATGELTLLTGNLERSQSAVEAERIRRLQVEGKLAECRRELEESRLAADQVRLDLDVVAGEKRELAEQKRVLVREVKAARRSLVAMKSMNEQLAGALNAAELPSSAGAEEAKEDNGDDEDLMLAVRDLSTGEVLPQPPPNCSSPGPVESALSGLRRFVQSRSKRGSQLLLSDGEGDDDERSASGSESPSGSECGRKHSASATQIICCKCSGTVEGPVYSTCKCTVPLLDGDDEGDAKGEGTTQSARALALEGKIRGLVRSLSSVIETAAGAKLSHIESEDEGDI